MQPDQKTRSRDFASVEPNASGGSSAIPANTVGDFRRSRWVPFDIPVDVYICRENEEPIFERGKTLDVSAHGALLALTTPVEIGQMLRLINPRTKKEIESHVRSIVRQDLGGGNKVSIEFVAVSPTFWDIASPPPDWDPAWVPPAKTNRPPALSPAQPPHQLQKRGAPTIDPEIEKLLREPVKASEITTKPKGWRWPMLALAASAVWLTLWIVAHRSGDGGPAARANSASSEMAAEDALIIPGLDRFRLATEEDFDPDAVSWLRGFGQEASSKIPGVYSGSEKSSAYILVGGDNARHVVILAHGLLCYEAEYPAIAVAALVSKQLIQKINWADPSPPESDGDGLLIVRAADAPASGVVLFLRGIRIVSANPADYRQIPLSQLP